MHHSQPSPVLDDEAIHEHAPVDIPAALFVEAEQMRISLRDGGGLSVETTQEYLEQLLRRVLRSG